MGKDFNDINEEIEIIEFPDVPDPETEFLIIDYPNDDICDPIGDIVVLNDCDPIGDITSIGDYSIGETITDENSGLKEGYQEDFITDYRRLMDTVVLNQQEKEKWYILLIFNPLNRTAAVDAFLNNYHYISERTKNIHYYIPGLKSLKGGFEETIRPNWSVFRLSKDYPVDMIFDRKGMLETVDWLEENCPSYSYREGIDLLLMKSCDDKGSRSLDVKNLIHLPLDQIHKKGGNVVDAITFVWGLVRRNVTLELARKEIEGYMERITGVCVRNFFKVFIAGSKDLYHERNTVRSQLQQISNLTNLVFSCYTYEDFPRDFKEEGLQAKYNQFIREEADFAIFIVDGKIGGITFEEFEVAMASFKENGRPRIFTYCKDVTTENIEIRQIIKEINACRQYYCEYHDLHNLDSGIRRDFMDVAWELRHK